MSQQAVARGVMPFLGLESSHMITLLIISQPDKLETS